MTIHEMQNLNRDTIEYASKVIAPGMSLIKLRKLCEEYMLSHGADSFWYWDVGAFFMETVIVPIFPLSNSVKESVAWSATIRNTK